MKNLIFRVLLVLMIAASTISCSLLGGGDSKKNEPFVIKYEILTSAGVSASSLTPIVSFTNSTGQIDVENITTLNSTKPWVKELTITSETRPLEINLLISAKAEGLYLKLDKQGTITQNVYKDNKLVASSTSQSSNINFFGGFQINVNKLVYKVE